jgi:hypothetical protein
VAAAALEPISPELVLVCPELRERALAELPDRAWEAWVAQVRIRTPNPAAPAEKDSGFLTLREFYRLGVGAFAAGTGVTLLLTLIADAIR